MSPVADGPVLPTGDDMHDTPEDLQRETPLGDYLRFCRDEIQPRFEDADRESLATQRRHRAFARWAAALATLSLLLALGQRAAEGALAPEWKSRLLLFEGLAVIGTVLIVAIGLLSVGHTRWLLRRYQAERLRLLKFRLLTDPRLWTGGGRDAVWRQGLSGKIEAIGKLRREDLTGVSRKEEVPEHPSREVCDRVPDPVLKEVLDYYGRRRLALQKEYFERSARRAEARLFKSPFLLPLFFFAGLVGALVHWVFKITELEPRRGLLSFVSVGTIALAGMLPAVWKGYKAYRGANEFARNASRSLSKRSALEQIAGRLSAERDRCAVFGELAVCEYILGSDQQEWLRLMLGARWYG
ncbi:MAG: hypothetical protein ABR576_01465 [Thermoanaerobaculia bacterium]